MRYFIREMARRARGAAATLWRERVYQGGFCHSYVIIACKEANHILRK